MEGLEEIIKKYKKINAQSNEDTNTKEIGVQRISQQIIEQANVDKMSSKSANDVTGAEKKKAYLVAKTIKDYQFISKLAPNVSNEKDLVDEPRIVFEDNGISIVKAILKIKTNKYIVEEEPLRPEELAVINLYKQFDKLTQKIDFSKKKIYDVYKEIVEVINDFIKQQNIDAGYIRTEVIAYYLVKEFGYYELTPVLLDKYIEDINGVENTEMVIHDSKYTQDFITNILLSRQKMDTILKRFAEYGKRTITPQELTAAVTLPEGSRFVCIYPFENQGVMSFSIRKQVFGLISPMKSIDSNFVTLDEMSFLAWVMSKNELGKIGYIGLPGSGKTSFLKTMALFMPESARVYSIETTPELMLTQKSWTKNTYAYENEAQVKLIESSLMYKPDYLIIGEVKLEKDLVDNMFAAMSSGFKTSFTFHADTTSAFISKMQSRSLDIQPDRIMNIKFLIFIIEDLSVKKRYIANIDEIYNFDVDNNRLDYQTILSTKNIKKESNYMSLCSLDYNTGAPNSISEELYNKFILDARLPLKTGPGVDPDILLLMVLKSKNIEGYAKIYGHGEDERPEYIEPQLRYIGQYKKIYLEMSGIRNFLIEELNKYNENKNNPNFNDVAVFLNDLNRNYNTLFNL